MPPCASTPFRLAATFPLSIALAAVAAPRQQDVTAPGGFLTACAAPSTSGGSTVPGSDATGAHASGSCQSRFFDGLGSASASASSSAAGQSNAASGTASLGLLRVRASNSAPNGAFFPQAVANGGWSDTLTVGLPGLDGQGGHLLVQLSVTGHIEASGFAGAGGFMVTGYRDEAELQRGNPGFDPGVSDLFTTDRQRIRWSLATDGTPPMLSRSVAQLVTLSVPVVVGQSFVLGVYGAANAGMRSSSGVPGVSTAEADFTSTLRWDGVAGVRIGDQLLTDGLTITSASGIDWVQPVPVPEPASAALLAAGLVGVGWAARRRRGPAEAVGRSLACGVPQTEGQRPRRAGLG